MKHLTIALLMLRYRVAVMLVLFFLLSVGLHRGFGAWRWAYVWAPLCLASGYITATSLNDISDRAIDRINHAGRRGRPLVTGEAMAQDLVRLAALTILMTLVFGALISPIGLLLAGASVAVAAGYSLPPLRLSHRTLLGPLVLMLAYVGLPYSLGLASVGQPPIAADIPFLLALAALFAGRILLKDFRDRRGDAEFGKRTFLLRFGKSTTCATCMLAVLSGDALLVFALPIWNAFTLAACQALFAGIVTVLIRCWCTDDEMLEQVGIGLGAKLGNGVLLTVLGLLALWSAGSSQLVEGAFAWATVGAFLLSVVSLARREPEVVLGYRG